MKPKELQKLGDKELLKLKKELKIELMKSSSLWGREKAENKKAGINTKGGAKQGQNTKLHRQIRRTLAQINSTIQQRGLSEELCKNKHRSKRRERRLRGRLKKGLKKKK